MFILSLCVFIDLDAASQLLMAQLHNLQMLCKQCDKKNKQRGARKIIWIDSIVASTIDVT